MSNPSEFEAPEPKDGRESAWGSTVFYAGSRVFLTWRVVFFLVAAASCRSERPAAALASMDVPFAGCSAVVRPAGGTTICETSDAKTVRLYPPGDAKRMDAPDKITIETTRARFVLELRPPTKLPWLDDARAARAKGDLDRAETAAKAIVDAAPRKPDVEIAFAHGILARVALARGRSDEAIPHFRTAISLHRNQNRISDAADDSFALAFALHQRSQRYTEAREVLDSVVGILDSYPEGRARAPYYRGILAAETGDRRGALLLLRDAEGRARDLGMTPLERNARGALALEMQELGRARESLLVLEKLERELEGAPPCERMLVANNLGWGAILTGGDARAPLERAIAVDGCADAYLRGFALANLARVALADGRLDDADARLAAARAGVKEPRGTERLGWIELEGRILLARKRTTDALARFEEMDALARAAVLPLSRWSALAGRAEALEALGREHDALAALRDAEDVLDDATLLVPLGEGRGGFLSDRSRTARAAIDLAFRTNRAAAGAAVARRSLVRGLESAPRALRIERLTQEDRAKWDAEVRAYRAARAAIDAEAADDWKLPRAELARVVDARKERERALRAALERAMAVLSSGAAREEAKLDASDLDVVIHPGRDRWIAFATDEAGTTAHAIAPPDARAEEIARTLLAPLAGRIATAKRLRVRAYGAYRRVDVHALPWEGAAIVAKLPVDYPLGFLPVAHGAITSPRAVVVGNPTGDLPSAEDEARAVARRLGDRGPVMTLLRAEASSEKIAGALRTSTTLHWAGHGVFGGLEGSESALPLSEGARLTVADVLALAPVPRLVVLSGCDTAKNETESEGLGIAQAFLAAGAEEVVAPTRPVADALAAKLAAAIYAGDPGEPLAAALRRATSRVREEDPALDWSAFRALAR